MSWNSLSARKLASKTSSASDNMENPVEGEAVTEGDSENQSSETEVVGDSLVPVSGSPIATENGQSSNTNAGVSDSDLPTLGKKHVVGEITMDYSRVAEGYVLLLCNSQPMFAINLSFLFGSMTRNARKKICTWLQAKDLVGFPALPLPSAGQSSTSAGSSSAAVSPSTPDSTSGTTGDNGSQSGTQSQTDAKNNLTAVSSKLRILCNLIGHDFSQHSNSVFSSLKSWAGKYEIVLCVRENKKLVPVNLDNLIEGFVSDIKNKRKAKSRDKPKNRQ